MHTTKPHRFCMPQGMPLAQQRAIYANLLRRARQHAHRTGRAARYGGVRPAVGMYCVRLFGLHHGPTMGAWWFAASVAGFAAPTPYSP